MKWRLPWRKSSLVCDFPREITQQAAFWLPVCPVHFIPDRDTLVLTHPHALCLSIEEAQQLAHCFNDHFKEMHVQLYPYTAECWLLISQRKINLALPSLDKAVAMNLRDAFNHGEDAQWWRKLLNETQMLWFTDPVNRQRETQGQLVVNGMWVLNPSRKWWQWW